MLARTPEYVTAVAVALGGLVANDKLLKFAKTSQKEVLVFTVAVGEDWFLAGGEDDELAAVWMQENVRMH